MQYLFLLERYIQVVHIIPAKHDIMEPILKIKIETVTSEVCNIFFL